VRLLLDTHILMWSLEDNPTLPKRARELVTDINNEIHISSISLWEIAIKVGTGKIRANARQIHQVALATGFVLLPFTPEHAIAVADLPHHHRDPFDRALLAQAIREPLHLLTHDEVLAAYSELVVLV
jgi:PIN domain nuclease of toxin-antitoxin system